MTSYPFRAMEEFGATGRRYSNFIHVIPERDDTRLYARALESKHRVPVSKTIPSVTARKAKGSAATLEGSRVGGADKNLSLVGTRLHLTWIYQCRKKKNTIIPGR